MLARFLFRCNIKFFVGFSGVGFSSGCGFHQFLVKIDYYEDVDGNQAPVYRYPLLQIVLFVFDLFK